MMRLLNIYPEEKRKTKTFSAILYLIAFGFSIGWIALHTVFVKRVGIEYLPYSYLGMSLFGVLGTFIYLIFSDKFQRQNIFIGTLLILVALLAFSRFYVSNHFSGSPGLTNELLVFSLLLFAIQGVCGFTLPTQAWTMISDVFTPNQAKRIYPFLGISTFLGGISGGIATLLSIDFIGAGNLLTVYALILLGMIPLAQLFPAIVRKSNLSFDFKENSSALSYLQNIKNGIRYVRQSSIAKLIMGVAVAFCVLNAWQDFQFTQIMNHSFQTEEALGRFFAYYWIAFSLTAIALQLFATEKVIRSLGVIRSLTILPVLVIVNLAILMIQYGFWEGLWLRYSWDTVGMAIQATAYQLAIFALPNTFRSGVRGWIEGIVNPAAAFLGGLGLLGIQIFIGFSKEALWNHYAVLILCGMALAGIWLGWILLHKRAYLNELKLNAQSNNIQNRIASIESLEEKRDLACYHALVQILQEPPNVQYTALLNEKVKRTAMQVLSRLKNPQSVTAIIPFLKNESPTIRAEAIRALNPFDSVFSNLFVYDYLKKQLEFCFFQDPSKEVRIEAGKFLISHHSKTELLQFVDKVLKGTASQKITIIKILSKISLPFHEVILQQLVTDSDLNVKTEAIVHLWDKTECRPQAEAELLKLLFYPNEKERKYGLFTLLRIHSPILSRMNFLDIPSDDLHLNCLKTLVRLSRCDPSSLEWEILHGDLIKYLSQAEYPYEDRIQFVQLFSILDERISSQFVKNLLKMDEESLQKIRVGLDQFQAHMYTLEEEEDAIARPIF